MTRVKGGTVSKKRRRKVLKAAKGYFGSKHRLYKTAQEQTFHSGAYAFRDRKQNKRNFRKLWITRINAACRANDISYSKFINGLLKSGVTVNRKMISEIAIADMAEFTKLVEIAKKGLEKPVKEVKSVDVKEEIKETPVKVIKPKKNAKKKPMVKKTPVIKGVKKMKNKAAKRAAKKVTK
jgi:large subunit ribosomal protein L20